MYFRPNCLTHSVQNCYLVLIDFLFLICYLTAFLIFSSIAFYNQFNSFNYL